MTAGPTLMMVGESGREHVQVTPEGKSASGTGETGGVTVANVTVNVNNQGTPLEVTRQEQYFNGDQMFVNLFVRNLQKNPSMRAALQGAR